jgi:hypothetical protein
MVAEISLKNVAAVAGTDEVPVCAVAADERLAAAMIIHNA